MDIVVKGRNVQVPDHYREHVNAKMTRLERYNRKAMRAEVELFHEKNPRQAKNCQRVEITLKGKGAPIRAEACAGDFYAALDAATTKLESRLRRMHDRRKVHYGQHNPTSVAEALREAGLPISSSTVTAGGLIQQVKRFGVAAKEPAKKSLNSPPPENLSAFATVKNAGQLESVPSLTLTPSLFVL